MQSKYSYKLRPTYGLGELLIEFFEIDKQRLIDDLIQIFNDASFFVTETEDMWMVDEVWINMKGKDGQFVISDAMYGYLFIFASKDQSIIYQIDELLSIHPLFEKEEVDFDDYRLPGTNPKTDEESDKSKEA